MKKAITIEIICSLFFLLFIYTSVSKILTYDVFKYDLGRDPLIGTSLANLAAILIPSVELLLAIFLIIPKTRRIGLYSSFVLMVFFTVYVGWMINSPTRHCTCGGVLREMTWKQHLWFNVFFSILAMTGIILYKNQIKMNSSKSLPVYK